MKFNKELRQALERAPGDFVLAVDTQDGPGMIIKTTEKNGLSLVKKNVIILFEPQLFLHPNAAVFRFYARFGDKAKNPAHLDTYLDPESKFDLDILHRLCLATLMRFYVVDFHLRPIGARGLPLESGFQLRVVTMVGNAIDHNEKVRHRDYALALQAFKDRVALDPTGGEKEIRR